MRIIAEIFKMPGGSVTPLIYALKENGQVDRAITDTLCDFVSHLFPAADKEFEDLLVRLSEGKYLPTNPSLGKLFTNRFWLCRSDARTKTAPALGNWARPAGTARGQLPGFEGALRPLQMHLPHTSHQLVPCHPQV